MSSELLFCDAYIKPKALDCFTQSIGDFKGIYNSRIIFKKCLAFHVPVALTNEINTLVIFCILLALKPPLLTQ